MKMWSIYAAEYKKYTHVVPIDEHYSNKKLMEEWFGIGGKPVRDTYTPMEFKKEFKSKTMCNISKFFHQLLFVDELALNVLSNILAHSYVEVLPIICKEKNLYAINILDVFNCQEILDMDKTKFNYFKSGRIMCVEKYAFISECIKDKDIIMINEWKKIVVSDYFKNTVEENNLIGVEFELLWNSES